MKHQELLSRMSLKDKIALCSGKRTQETKTVGFQLDDRSFTVWQDG